MDLRRILSDCREYKESIILVVTPFILSPILFTLGWDPVSVDSNGNETAVDTGLAGPPARCLYCVLLMAVYWMAEVLPLAVTALMPIFLFPILNILPSKAVCTNYLTDTNFLFVGGLIVAVAVENSNLHQRIALKVLTIVGSKPQWIMLGFMSVTAFLSMWISNTATTAMMVPIAQSVIIELLKFSVKPPSASEAESGKRLLESELLPLDEEEMFDDDATNGMNSHVIRSKPEKPKPPTIPIALAITDAEGNIDLSVVTPKAQKMAKGLLISICFAANIGGTGTVTGTPPNLVMVGQINDKLYPGQDTGINFASWMAFAVIPMVIALVVCWAILVLHFLGFGIIFNNALCMRIPLVAKYCKRRVPTAEASSDGGVERVIRQKYNSLPPWSFAEIQVLICFLLLLAMWIFRDPKSIPGFGELFNPTDPVTKKKTIYFSDATSAMIIAVILFALPMEKPDFLCTSSRDKNGPPKKRKSIMTWAAMQSKFSWSVVMLLGGGFALAAGVKNSGLSNWIGNQLQRLSSLSTIGIQFVCVLVTMVVTNITSNTVTASIFVPIVNGLALKLGENPLALVIPTTLACSYAFLLPVATPPNAIVFASGMLKVGDMMVAGTLVSVVSLLLIVFFSQTYINLILGLASFPIWALSSVKNPELRNALAASINQTIS